MKANSKHLVKLLNGTYDGFWSGYVVEIPIIGLQTYKIITTIGVRGLNIPAKIHVVNGKAVIESLK